MSTSGQSDHLIVKGHYLLDEELRARLTAACRRSGRAALLFGASDSVHTIFSRMDLESSRSYITTSGMGRCSRALALLALKHSKRLNRIARWLMI